VRTSRLIVTVIGILGSAAALAGPFCVVTDGMPANCRFYDEASCMQAAINANGGCIDKSKSGQALSVEPRNARYCLVSGGTSKCYFYDAQSCANAAKLNGGTCLTRPSHAS
jgi:hypothetical protein